MRGNIFENFVVMEAVKHRMNAGKEGGVFFYRDSNMNEVDVLIKEEGEITALEIKSSMTYNRDFENNIEDKEDRYGWKNHIYEQDQTGLNNASQRDVQSQDCIRTRY